MMKHVDLLDTNDAMVWAEEFVKTMKRNDWTLEEIDASLMIGWFANAMCAQEYAMLRRLEVQNQSIYKEGELTFNE